MSLLAARTLMFYHLPCLHNTHKLLRPDTSQCLDLPDGVSIKFKQCERLNVTHGWMFEHREMVRIDLT